MNYEEYFEPRYEYSLKEINYITIPSPKEEVKCQQSINDTITGTIEKGLLQLRFTRTAIFTPEYIYNLRITYEIHLTFKENVIIKPEQDGEYWSTLFLHENTQLFGDICSRISLIMANITGSDNRVPLILPPQPVGVFAKNQ